MAELFASVLALTMRGICIQRFPTNLGTAVWQLSLLPNWILYLTDRNHATKIYSEFFSKKIWLAAVSKINKYTHKMNYSGTSSTMALSELYNGELPSPYSPVDPSFQRQ